MAVGYEACIQMGRDKMVGVPEWSSSSKLSFVALTISTVAEPSVGISEPKSISKSVSSTNSIVALIVHLSFHASACSLSTMHFLKIVKNSLEVLKVLKNSLQVLKVLKNSLEVLEGPADGAPGELIN
nr:hypothetical protein [Tanacetum cinerariifolium]